MIAQVFTSSVIGIEPIMITIEVNVSMGTKFYIVGLPDNMVRESQQRIESAIKYFGYYMPRQKVTINLAPASLKKEGTAFDLPIALAILLASGQMKTNHLKDYIILGELSLLGELRMVKGVLPIAIEARKKKFKGIILPQGNKNEAAIIHDIDVLGVGNIKDAIDFFENKKTITPHFIDTRNIFNKQNEDYAMDFSNIHGQENIRRALEVSAAGGHNVVIIGPPGSGKTMISQRIPSILPPLSLQEALETTKIYSVAGKLMKINGLISQRPFRAPHHTISSVALVGGGSHPLPGEISLAHNGVLFLDELPEFQRVALETLRQPLESRNITISRAKYTVTFPANFMFIASMNPCPCGYHTHPDKPCVCSASSIQRYKNKISGPLLDRIDIHIEAVPVTFDKLSRTDFSEKSEKIRDRVIQARKIQEKRFEKYKFIHSNAMLSPELIKKVCKIDTSGTQLLKKAMERFKLSARAYHRILKLARTIADLSAKENIEVMHLAEAVQYRVLDKENV